MKIPNLSGPRFTWRASRENGTAVIVVIALLSIILIYLAGNMRCLHLLKRDLTILERQQTRRLELAGKTNAVPAALNPAGVNLTGKPASAEAPAVSGR
jgi:hypothetical protein